MKLNLGCGKHHVKGHINIDLLPPADQIADIADLNYAKETVSEITAIHVFEHLPRMGAQTVLGRWFDILKPGGKLMLELPCLDKAIHHFVTERPENLTMWPLFGDPSNVGWPENVHEIHRWCYRENELREMLQKAGFDQVLTYTPLHHVPERDMRLEAIKPC